MMPGLDRDADAIYLARSGKTLSREFLAWGKPVYALPVEGNAHLFAAGARAWGAR